MHQKAEICLLYSVDVRCHCVQNLCKRCGQLVVQGPCAWVHVQTSITAAACNVSVLGCLLINMQVAASLHWCTKLPIKCSISHSSCTAPLVFVALVLPWALDNPQSFLCTLTIATPLVFSRPNPTGGRIQGQHRRRLGPPAAAAGV